MGFLMEDPALEGGAIVEVLFGRFNGVDCGSANYTMLVWMFVRWRIDAHYGVGSLGFS